MIASKDLIEQAITRTKLEILDAKVYKRGYGLTAHYSSKKAKARLETLERLANA